MGSAIPHLTLVVPYGLLCGHIDPMPGHRVYDQVKAILAHRAELRNELSIETFAQISWWFVSGYFQGFIRGLCFQWSVWTISSYLFAFFTQVSHLQEECHVDSTYPAKLSFAKRQVVTSIDFAPDSAIWGHLSGGLNTQAIQL